MNRIFTDITRTVGNTPIVRINRLAPAGQHLFAKLEAFNPMGSVKDRMALRVIETAERDGRLRPGMTVVEATSGNTGIGLAMVCAAKGYPLVLVMAESFSVERRRILRFLGARVVLTPAEDKGSGMLAKAVELAGTHGWFLVRQFDNEANAEAHERTTAREIVDAFASQALDFFVTGYGTGGTLKGVGKVLRRERPDTQIVVCEPDNSPLLGSGIQQSRADDGSPAASHPHFRPHLMQGWTPDFIPRLTEDAVRAGYADRIMPVDGNEALRLSRELARKEGIFTGISGGATLAGALTVCMDARPGSTVLCMLPDTGERYLSTPLFQDIPAEMSDEEIGISRSTPGYRFDTRPAQPPAAVAVSTAEPRAVEFVQTVVSDPQKPLVLFALEWCEFCWSVRKLFVAAGLEFRAVDLDSVAYQENDWGGQIRGALYARLGSNTIPQIFVGGEHIGGCTDFFDAWKAGRIHPLLERCGIATDRIPPIDPYTLLPGWLHKR